MARFRISIMAGAILAWTLIATGQPATPEADSSTVETNVGATDVASPSTVASPASVAPSSVASFAPDVAAETPTDAHIETHLGVDDVIQIRALDAEEFSDKPVRIGADGFINLPTVGRIKAAGRTVEQLQTELAERLKRYIVNPDVSVSLLETHSQPVSVVGAVKTPGIIQLNGPKTLVEVLSMAGGPRDDAGYLAKITRRKDMGDLPLANATADSTGLFSVAEVNLQNVMDARDPASNIAMMANDVINVPKASMVYVIGDVQKAIGIVMGDQKGVTALQALAIASGLGKTAKSTEAKILRLTPGSATRTELPVNLKKILAGKLSDIPMQAEDILYVPTSLKKDVGFKTLEALGGSASSAIYRIP